MFKWLNCNEDFIEFPIDRINEIFNEINLFEPAREKILGKLTSIDKHVKSISVNVNTNLDTLIHLELDYDKDIFNTDLCNIVDSIFRIIKTETILIELKYKEAIKIATCKKNLNLGLNTNTNINYVLSPWIFEKNNGQNVIDMLEIINDYISQNSENKNDEIFKAIMESVEYLPFSPTKYKRSIATKLNISPSLDLFKIKGLYNNCKPIDLIEPNTLFHTILENQLSQIITRENQWDDFLNKIAHFLTFDNKEQLRINNYKFRTNAVINQ